MLFFYPILYSWVFIVYFWLLLNDYQKWTNEQNKKKIVGLKK